MFFQLMIWRLECKYFNERKVEKFFCLFFSYVQNIPQYSEIFFVLKDFSSFLPLDSHKKKMNNEIKTFEFFYCFLLSNFLFIFSNTWKIIVWKTLTQSETFLKNDIYNIILFLNLYGILSLILFKKVVHEQKFFIVVMFVVMEYLFLCCKSWYKWNEERVKCVRFETTIFLNVQKN